jgi:hypothetical protein
MTILKGVNVPGVILPFTDTDIYATHDALYGRGGCREVDTTTIRDAIPSDRLSVGMLVTVRGDKTYQWTGSAWTDFLGGIVTEQTARLSADTALGNRVAIFESAGASAVGALSALTTTAKTTSVAAINEINSKVLAVTGAVVYQGVWNASSNSPDLVSTVSNTNRTKGFSYKVQTAGTTSLDGISQWNIGDYAIFNGSSWDKIDGLTSEVVTVAGRTGAVTLTTTDIGGINALVGPEPTNQYFIDGARSDTYTANGSIPFPFKTIAAAIAHAASDSRNDSNPAWFGIYSPMTESTVSITHGGIFFNGVNGSGTHSPIVITGAWTFNGADGSLTANHFALANLELTATSADVITFAGTVGQRLFLKDIWITANTAGTYALNMTNTSNTSIIEIDGLKVSHNASTGDNYCLNVSTGTVDIDDMETSGNTQIARVTSGSLNITNSELDAVGFEAFHVASGALLTIANSEITNTYVNSSGIMLDSGATAILGNVIFAVPMGVGSLSFASTTAGSGIVVTGTGTSFVSSDIGRVITLYNGKTAQITAVAGNLSITVAIPVTLTYATAAVGTWTLGYAIEAPVGSTAICYFKNISFLPLPGFAYTNSFIGPNVKLYPISSIDNGVLNMPASFLTYLNTLKLTSANPDALCKIGEKLYLSDKASSHINEVAVKDISNKLYSDIIPYTDYLSNIINIHNTGINGEICSASDVPALVKLNGSTSEIYPSLDYFPNMDTSNTTMYGEYQVPNGISGTAGANGVTSVSVFSSPSGISYISHISNGCYISPDGKNWFLNTGMFAYLGSINLVNNAGTYTITCSVATFTSNDSGKYLKLHDVSATFLITFVSSTVVTGVVATGTPKSTSYAAEQWHIDDLQSVGAITNSGSLIANPAYSIYSTSPLVSTSVASKVAIANTGVQTVTSIALGRSSNWNVYLFQSGSSIRIFFWDVSGNPFSSFPYISSVNVSTCTIATDPILLTPISGAWTQPIIVEPSKNIFYYGANSDADFALTTYNTYIVKIQAANSLPPITLLSNLPSGSGSSLIFKTNRFVIVVDYFAQKIYTAPMADVIDGNAVAWTDVTSSVTDISIMTGLTWSLGPVAGTFWSNSSFFYVVNSGYVIYTSDFIVFNVFVYNTAQFTVNSVNNLGLLFKGHAKGVIYYLDSPSNILKKLTIPNFLVESIVSTDNTYNTVYSNNVSYPNNVLFGVSTKSLYIPKAIPENVSSTTVNTSASGTNIALTLSNTTLIHNPGSTLTSQTYVLPQNPFDGLIVTIICYNIITTCTVSVSAYPTAQSLVGYAAGAYAANTTLRFIYNISQNTWYKL